VQRNLFTSVVREHILAFPYQWWYHVEHTDSVFCQCVSPRSAESGFYRLVS
jgi:hypothetical protein